MREDTDLIKTVFELLMCLPVNWDVCTPLDDIDMIVDFGPGKKFGVGAIAKRCHSNDIVKLMIAHGMEDKSLDQRTLYSSTAPEIDLDEVLTFEQSYVAKIIADVLDIPVSRIGKRTSFFTLGGDSLSAVKFVEKLTKIGFYIDPSALYKYDTLESLTSAPIKNKPDAPSRLVLEDAIVEQAIANNVFGYRDRESFEVFPLTPLQKGMLTATAMESTECLYQFPVLVKRSIDIQQLRNAYLRLLESHDLLRSQFIVLDSGMYRVCPTSNNFRQFLTQTSDSASDEFPVFEAESLEKYTDEDRRKGFNLSDRFWLRVGLVKKDEESCQLVVTINHCMFDGWSFVEIAKDLIKLCRGDEIEPSLPFSMVTDYVATLNTKDFWIKELEGLSIEQPKKIQNPKKAYLKRELTNQAQEIKRYSQSRGISAAVVLKLAWALTLRYFSGKSDVVFNEVLYGRDAPIPGAKR